MNTTVTIILYVVPNVAWISVVIYLIMRPEVAEKWGAIFLRLFYKISKKAEMQHVALDIQGKVNSFAKSINKQAQGIIPYGIKIKWVTGEITRESFLEGNDVIIRINYHTNQDENIIRITEQFIMTGLLHDSRPYVDEKVMRATDLIMVKNMIQKEHHTALPVYYSDVLNPELSADDEISDYVTMMQQLDQLSFFTPVFLKELQFLGVKMQFSIPEPPVKEETRNLIRFLNEKVTKRRPGEDVSPTFVGNKIKVSIVYVSRTGIAKRHLKWIDKCAQMGIDRIYLCARGRNVYVVKELDNELGTDPRWKRLFETVTRLPIWRGRRTEFICVGYSKHEQEEETSP